MEQQGRSIDSSPRAETFSCPSARFVSQNSKASASLLARGLHLLDAVRSVMNGAGAEPQWAGGFPTDVIGPIPAFGPLEGCYFRGLVWGAVGAESL